MNDRSIIVAVGAHQRNDGIDGNDGSQGEETRERMGGGSAHQIPEHEVDVFVDPRRFGDRGVAGSVLVFVVIEVVGRYPREDRISVEDRDPCGEERVRGAASERRAVVVIVREDSGAESDVERERQGPHEAVRKPAGKVAPSQNPSAARAAAKPAAERTKACATDAAVQSVTAQPVAIRSP